MVGDGGRADMADHRLLSAVEPAIIDRRGRCPRGLGMHVEAVMEMMSLYQAMTMDRISFWYGDFAPGDGGE